MRKNKLFKYQQICLQSINKFLEMKQTGHKQYDYQYKFVMVGDSAVGKSSLLLRFADNQFNENYMITIGVDFRFKSVNINNKIVKLQIWDTAGQQRFRTIVNTYYKNSHAVYLIFDLTSKDSFNSIKNYWINQVESYTDQSAVIVLVGNKADYGDKAVSEEQIRKFAQQKKLHYFQTSAKTNNNVSEMFINIAQHLTDKRLQGKLSNVGTHEGARKLEPTNGESSQSKRNCYC